MSRLPTVTAIFHQASLNVKLVNLDGQKQNRSTMNTMYSAQCLRRYSPMPSVAKMQRVKKRDEPGRLESGAYVSSEAFSSTGCTQVFSGSR